MKTSDRHILEVFSEKLHGRFPFARIWAFGSRATETAGKDSDFDVCVVVNELNEAMDREIMRIAWEIGFENNVVISTVTYSTEEFETGPCSESGLVKRIHSEGIAA